MAQRNASRMMADVEGEFLVFVIELQIHKIWQVWRWYPVIKAMTAMIVELLERPELGLMSFEYRFSFRQQPFIMYWRSFEHMHDWATARGNTHADGWRMLNKLMKKHPDLLGFWHESFVVSQYESFYRNVPAVGLGKAATLVPMRGGIASSAARLRAARADAA